MWRVGIAGPWSATASRALRSASYETTRTNQTRNYAMRRLSLARIYLEMHELDAACAHASSVLALAQQLRSRHLANRLEHMHKLLDRWHTVSAVRD
jgi:hypothetical protein